VEVDPWCAWGVALGAPGPLLEAVRVLPFAPSPLCPLLVSVLLLGALPALVRLLLLLLESVVALLVSLTVLSIIACGSVVVFGTV